MEPISMVVGGVIALVITMALDMVIGGLSYPNIRQFARWLAQAIRWSLKEVDPVLGPHAEWIVRQWQNRQIRRLRNDYYLLLEKVRKQ